MSRDSPQQVSIDVLGIAGAIGSAPNITASCGIQQLVL